MKVYVVLYKKVRNRIPEGRGGNIGFGLRHEQIDVVGVYASREKAINKVACENESIEKLAGDVCWYEESELKGMTT